MAFQLSPGVLVVEKDLTNVVPAVATSIGAFAGDFQWGPVNDPVTISSEIELVKTFGKPNNVVASSFFTAASFLSYSNNLKLVRAAGADSRNAVSMQIATFDGSTDVSSVNDTITVTGHGFVTGTPLLYSDGGGSAPGSLTDDTVYYAIVVDSNTIKLAEDLADAGTETEIDIASGGSGSSHTLTPSIFIQNEDEWEALYSTGSGRVGSFAAKYAGGLGSSLKVVMGDAGNWSSLSADYQAEFDYTPATTDYASNLGGSSDEIHILIIDEDGLISGTQGTILERWTGLSKASDARTTEGAVNYYREALRGSQYIWWMDHPTNLNVSGSAWGSNAAGTTFKTLSSAIEVSLVGGAHDTPSDANVITAYDEFANAELIDINLVMVGPHSNTVAQSVVDLAQTRLDCIAFVSPQLSSVYANAGSEADDIVTDRNNLNRSTSYAVMDSGWKYQYDKYNDVYRWIPLNGDTAGLCARTDAVADPWFSPGGLNRGQIKNVVKLAYSPDKTDRDTLYKVGVNPVVSFPGEGTVLFGDKTLLSKPSAFDRINVRRLFIVLEKAIALAAKYQLFEFNDAFTRAQFRNLVEPFLRDIRGRRGIYDFRVICDETNNTGEVIDRNEFVADIFIKPARSINFITLNFIATRTGVAFEEVAGA